MSDKVLFIFGTRPEAIKLAPLILHLQTIKNVETRICATGQHKELLESALNDFGIETDYNLEVMQIQQQLADLTSTLISRLSPIIASEKPSLVIVQGDTSSAMCGALSAYYNKIPVAHIEAGLRSHNSYSPFPEEVNRKIISQIATLHFCPTADNKSNLNKEGITDQVFCTGNTGIDALDIIASKNPSHKKGQTDKALDDNHTLLVTIHRRENIPLLYNIAVMINQLVQEQSISKIKIVLHPNPKIEVVLRQQLDMSNSKLEVLPPQSYANMVQQMNEATLLLTDSGGLQEEATYLGLATIVLRKETERNEVIESGLAKLLSPAQKNLAEAVIAVLRDKNLMQELSRPSVIYGDGDSSKRIIMHLLTYLKDQ